MDVTSVLFYVFAAVLLFAAFRVITVRNPVYAALYLVLAFFQASGIWMLLQAEFLSITLVVVYVGAVMVLFLFVVMMLDINLERIRQGFWSYLPIGALIGILMLAEMVVVLGSRYFGLDRVPQPGEFPAGYSNTKELGRLIYTDYVYPFELASIVLLVAMIAAVALTLRKRNNVKKIDPAKQIAVKRDERVRVVSMDAEKK